MMNVNVAFIPAKRNKRTSARKLSNSTLETSKCIVYTAWKNYWEQVWHRVEIVSREEWGARPPKFVTPFEMPVDYVIIIHTATYTCKTKEECIRHLRIIQFFHMDSRMWPDISYNFLVGGEGRIYEGRGWDNSGDHSKGYNSVSLGISLIGIFCDVHPPEIQIQATKDLIREGVRLGKISPNYKLVAHRQISPTESPGEMLYQDLQKWDHWSPEV